MQNSQRRSLSCVGIMDKALSLEQAGEDVVHLEKGELDFDTPSAIKESAIQAIRENKTRYTSSTGLAELREAICEYHARTYGVTFQPSQVIVNAGSSPALLALFLALVSAGDEVIIPNPCYPAYARYVQVAGGKPVHIHTASRDFAYTAQAAEEAVTETTRALLVNFPSNPVGATIDGPGLEGFARLGPLIVSDEVYHSLTFIEERPHSILEFTDNAVVANSFSKAFAMTGWRLGYVIVPSWLVPRVKQIQQDFFISPNSFVQWAGLTALTDAEQVSSQRREALRRRRDRLLEGLSQLGFIIPCEPRGAFYIFAKLPEGWEDSAGFAADLLDAEHVAVTPGSEFGSDGEGYVRFSYATPLEGIERGIDRIGAFLARSSPGRMPRSTVPSCSSSQAAPGGAGVMHTPARLDSQDELFTHIKGYYVVESLLALWRIGLLQRLAEGGPVVLDEFAEAEDCDGDRLRSLLDYLIVRGYCEGENGVYSLSERGKAATAYYGYLPMLVGAYEPIFANLRDVLAGRLLYGQHLTRSEHELTLGVSALEKHLLGRLTEIVGGIRFNKVLDLGCGSARMLSRVCQFADHIKGVGVDWQEETCEEAKKLVAREGLQDRVMILQGDAGRLEDLPGTALAGVDLVISMFLMHEILKQRGRAGVVGCLRSIAGLLGERGRFVMVEVSKTSSYQAQEGLLFVPEYELVHDFSNQQLAAQDEWEEMLDMAGIRVLETASVGMCRAFCFLAARGEPARR